RNTPSQSRENASEMEAALRQLPGVDGATISSFPPLTRRLWTEHAGSNELIMNAVDASYFSMMRLPLLQGRIFEARESDAIVVSESAARRIWPKELPLGKDLQIGDHKRTVVGVVKDSGANVVNRPDSAEVYTPIADKDAALAMILIHIGQNH